MKKITKASSSFAKRAIAAALTAVSCLSVVTAPQLMQGNGSAGQIGITADAAEFSYRVIADASRGNVTLRPNGWYYSPNHQYLLIFVQKTGKLVVYDETSSERKVKWQSPVSAPYGECVMQKDGNLVIYSAKDANGKRKPVWNTETNGNNYSSLILDDNGTLYIESGFVSPKRTWTTFETEVCEWHVNNMTLDEMWNKGR
jgi:hypothetical protein